MDAHRRFGDNAERSLAADAQMVHINSVRRFRHHLRREHSIGRHHAQRDHHVLDFAVLVALHPGGPRRDPAAQSRMQKRIRKMSQRHSVRAQLVFEIRAKYASLNARRKRMRIHRQHPPHAPHIERCGHAMSFHPLETARDIRPAAERDDHHVMPLRRAQHHRNIVFALRINHHIGSAFGPSAPHAKQIPEPLAVGVNGSLEAAIADLSRVQNGFQLSQKASVDDRLRQFDRLERHGRHARTIPFNSQHFFRVGPEAGMGLRVEPRLDVSPTPPLHVPRAVIHKRPLASITICGNRCLALRRTSRTAPERRA